MVKVLRFDLGVVFVLVLLVLGSGGGIWEDMRFCRFLSVCGLGCFWVQAFGFFFC